MDQIALETLTSRRNTRNILQRTIAEELDGVLLDWALKAFITIPTWIKDPWIKDPEGIKDQKPYQSKKDRITILKDWLKTYGLENLILDIAYAVLHDFKDVTLQSAVGILSTTLPYEYPFEAASIAGSLLAILNSDDNDGLYTLINRSKERKMHLIQINHWPDLVPAFAGAYAWINDTQYNLPLIEPPRKVLNNHNAGYHSIKEPVILGRFTQHDMPLNLKPLNILNRIKWTFDTAVIAGTPVLPDKLTDETSDALLKGMQVAQSYLKDKSFYLVWQVDSRGRLYSHGYHVNFQSFEWMKASITSIKSHKLTH